MVEYFHSRTPYACKVSGTRSTNITVFDDANSMTIYIKISNFSTCKSEIHVYYNTYLTTTVSGCVLGRKMSTTVCPALINIIVCCLNCSTEALHIKGFQQLAKSLTWPIIATTEHSRCRKGPMTD